MKKSLTLLLWLTCSALFLTGCSSYDRATISVGLSVELAGIERASDGTVSVTWTLVNPNIAPYLLSRASSKVYLNGTLVGTTMDKTAMAFPAQQSISKATRLISAGPAADSLISAAVAAGKAAYRVETQIIMQLYGDVTEKANLSHTGSVPVTAK